MTRPNTYRVQCRWVGHHHRPKHWWSRTWQAEWDDRTELGAFRAHTERGAIAKAIRARDEADLSVLGEP